MKLNTFMIIGTTIILGLMILSFFNGLILLASNNEATIVSPTITNTLDSLQNNLSFFKDNIDSADASVTNSSVTTGGDSSTNFILNSLRGVKTILKEVPIAIYNSTIGFLKIYLFQDSNLGIILDIFAGLLIFALIIAFVRWLVTGQGGGE